jgi:hypothetical protein
MAQNKLATVQKASTSRGLRDRVPAVKCITLRVRVDDAYPCETDHDFPDDPLPGLAGLPAFRPSITTRDVAMRAPFVSDRKLSNSEQSSVRILFGRGQNGTPS